MRSILAAAILLVAQVASAQTTAYACIDHGVVINGLALTSARSFEIERGPRDGGFGVLTLYIALTDANASITRLDIACTVSPDDNTNDYTMQVCDNTEDGVCTLTAVTGWQKASPGTSKFPIRVDINGHADYECTVSSGAGTPAAADVVTVRARQCVE